MRKSIVRLLVTRNVSCSREMLARIEACTDPDRLNAWLDKAFEATTEAEVFGTGD